MDVRAKVLTYAVQSAIHTCNTFVCIMVHDFSAQYATHMCTDNIEITPVLRIRNTGVFSGFRHKVAGLGFSFGHCCVTLKVEGRVQGWQLGNEGSQPRLQGLQDPKP